jgi:acetylornithine deacetylase/succinyl-diaminopimelate desuccinylase-like protein
MISKRSAFCIPGMFVAAIAGAQTSIPVDNPRMKSALELIRLDNAWTVDQQRTICEIPAPPFKEATRAAEYKRRLEGIGFRNVRIDSEGNVIAMRPGKGNGPTVLIAGHLDTVFPEGTDVKVTTEGTVMKGPGIADDCRGLAVLLQVAKSLDKAGVETNGTIYFVGNVGEEGPGNLRGTRHLFTKELAGKIDYFISIDGAGYGLTSRAVGSHRYRVTYKGSGGHSYGAFGTPNPIHALGRAIAIISDLQVPSDPRVTFNVGVISGGTSVNSISENATMEVDMRSESAAELAKIDERIQAALQKALADENARWVNRRARLTIQIDTIGIRPTGSQSDTALIVRTAIAAGKALGFSEPTGASSTDANLPISMGIPAITIDGGGRGTGAHTTSETYDDTAKGYLGPQWAALLITALAGIR